MVLMDGIGTMFGQLMPGGQPVKARLDGMAEVFLNE